MFRVVRKLKLLKREFQALNKHHFTDIVEMANEDRQELENTQLALQAKPTDKTLLLDEKEKYIKFRHSSYMAEIFL